MLARLRSYCTKALEKMFEEEDPESRDDRIESARISSTRLKALERIRENKVIAPSITDQFAVEDDEDEPYGVSTQLG